jgi:methylamine utilization protein MauE
MALFTTAIALALVRGRRPDCGCFGARSTRTGRRAGAGAQRALVCVAGVALVPQADGGVPRSRRLGDRASAAPRCSRSYPADC